MAHSAHLDNHSLSDLLQGITRQVAYLENIDTRNRQSAIAPVIFKGRDMPGVAEAYALLNDLVAKIRDGEI